MRARWILLMLLAAVQLPAQTRFMEIEAAPTDMDAFTALRDARSNEPEGAAAVFLTALLVYSENPALGEQAVVLCSDATQLSPGSVYKGYSLNATPRYLLERLAPEAQPWVARSYLRGSTQASAYAQPPGPLVFALSRNPSSGADASGRVKLFVESSGADTPRPLTLARNARGVWKVLEWSSLSVGVRPPIVEADEL